MKQSKIAATKIKPTVIIGEDIKISTRNIKSNKKPPKKSEDCGVRFKEFVTDDTTDVLLNESYTKDICEDMIDTDFLDSNNYNEDNFPYILLTNKNDTINAKRVLIYSSNLKLMKKEKLKNKSHRHKATEYNLKELTICGILQEEENIFQSNIIDKLRKAKQSMKPDEDGFYNIDEVKKLD